MSELPPVPRGGAVVVAITWAVAGVVHVVIGLGADGFSATLAFVLAAVAAVGAAALLVTPRGELLIAAAVAGALGVAAFALPLILPLLGVGEPVADPTAPWAIGGFLIDALTVRLAIFTLRRASRVRGQSLSRGSMSSERRPGGCIARRRSP